MKRRLLRVAVWVIATAVMSGAAGPLGAQDQPCGATQTQVQMNQCAEIQAANVDRRLTRLLGEIKAKIEPGRQAGLDSAQTIWMRYRRAHCRWVAGAYEGGSMQALVLSGCMENVAWARIEELRILLCDEEEKPYCDASQRYSRPQ